MARIGGDEFAILLEDLDREADVMHVVHRITAALRPPVALRGREVTLSASIGVAHTRGAERVDELLRNADVAMYRAKDEGKARYAVFEPGMHAALLERLELEADLRHAVERGELHVVYQPIVAAGDGTRSPALRRWLAGSGRDTNAVRRRIHSARRGDGSDRADWPMGVVRGVPAGPRVAARIAVFVHTDGERQRVDAAASRSEASFTTSSRCLRDTQFPADPLDPRDHGERAHVELTRSRATRLCELKALGIRIAIDDFGTGYSSLSYLQRFPIDILKIDRSFVTNMARSDGDAALASSIVGLATSLNLHTVAEGIEHAGPARASPALGCAFGQGYLFAKPVTPAAIQALLEQPSVTSLEARAEAPVCTTP